MIQFSETHALVTVALLAVQREVQPVVKDRQNPLLHSKYATLDAITDYVRPLLAKNDLTLLQSVSVAGAGLIAVESMLMHVSGEWVKNTVPVPISEGNKGTSAQQAAGATITYGRRYGLSALLALTTDEDTDGNAGTSQRREARRASRTSAHLNANGITTAQDIPFPKLRGMEPYHGTPMRDVPQEVLEEGYRRTKDRPEKNAQGFAKAMEVELERRRGANDFETAHPALHREEALV